MLVPDHLSKDFAVVKVLTKQLPGKPFAPEAMSLFVDWLPALFAHSVEYPRP
jgi:hypothetical protein